MYCTVRAVKSSSSASWTYSTERDITGALYRVRSGILRASIDANTTLLDHYHLFSWMPFWAIPPPPELVKYHQVCLEAVLEYLLPLQ